MPVESAADRASFFDGDEFATAARYTPPGGVTGATITVVYDRGQAKQRFEAGADSAATAERMAWINADDAPVVARDGVLEVGHVDDAGAFVVDETLTVAGNPVLDETGHLWSADLVLVD